MSPFKSRHGTGIITLSVGPLVGPLDRSSKNVLTEKLLKPHYCPVPPVYATDAVVYVVLVDNASFGVRDSVSSKQIIGRFSFQMVDV